MIKPELVEKFWSQANVGEADQCWVWSGDLTPNGYGRFAANNRHYRANRISLSLKLGRELTAAELACHTCDNPPCVNPAHLFAGSGSDNRIDCLTKGRAVVPVLCGEANGRAKLAAEQVERIRSRKGVQVQRETAQEFGVSRQTVSAIQNGYRWSASGDGA